MPSEEFSQEFVVTATIRLPRLPNFVILSDGQSLPVEALTDDSLRHLGAAWTDALVRHAQRRREGGPDA